MPPRPAPTSCRQRAAVSQRTGTKATTLRAIAADVGVDAALVTRYFGSKQDLFATATEFRIELPDLTGAGPDDIADMLLPRYFAVWEDDHSFLALLRAASTSRIAADTLEPDACHARSADVESRHSRQSPDNGSP